MYRTANSIGEKLFQLLYDLVTCCHTLLELPSREARLVAVDTLWRKTEHGGFFVLVEDGTNAGFEASTCSPVQYVP